MSDDEPTPPEDGDELEDSQQQLKTTNDDDEHQLSDMEHEKEDLQELEKARKERMDLMAAELKEKEKSMKKGGGENKEGDDDKVEPFDKFQYLVGQSEVFAHFLAGEFI